MDDDGYDCLDILGQQPALDVYSAVPHLPDA